MSAIQVVLILFAGFALSRVVMRFRAGGLPIGHLLVWCLFWLGVIVVALWPAATSAIARALGVGRGADVVLYLALVALFYLSFRMFGKIEDLERQITRVVRAAALKELDQTIGKKTLPPPR